MRRRLVVSLIMIMTVSACTNSLLPKPPSVNQKTAASLGQSDWPVLGRQVPVLGIDLYAHNNYSAAQVETYGQRTLTYIKNVLKADAVGIVWNFYAPNLYSPVVQATKATLSASNVAILTKIAMQKHLLVQYRPLILVPSTQNHWAGLVNPYPPTKWFNSFFDAELPYLKAAQQFGVREFVTASEMQDLNNSPLWPSFFTRISRVYHGIISYSAWDGNYFGTSPGNSFQIAKPELLPVKYIGMDMYWHTNIPANATASQVLAAWTDLFGKVTAPVLARTAIDEIGIQARVGAYSAPQALDAAGGLDEQVQVNWFTAACSTVRRFHMRGVFFFKVNLTDNPVHPAKSLSTFEGKEGVSAIRQCVQILH